MTCIWAAAMLAAIGSAVKYFIMTRLCIVGKFEKSVSACTASNRIYGGRLKGRIGKALRGPARTVRR